MYELIAQEYERLFPLDPDRVQLAKRLSGDRPAAVLDVGCATGEFVRALAAQLLPDGMAQFRATGIDPDSGLLEIARRQSGTLAEKLKTAIPEYRQQGMLDIGEAAAYDQIYCMGNTLPHLADAAEISAFLARAWTALRAGGCLILQLINFNPIIGLKEYKFPVLETAELRFFRSYRNIQPESLDFGIHVEARQSGQIQKATVPLFPVRPDLLKHLLVESGFNLLTFAASYDLRPFSGKESHFIVLALKD